MRNANAPGVGRASGKLADSLRGMAVYLVPLVLFGGLWVLAGLYKTATSRQVVPAVQTLAPALLDKVTFAEPDQVQSDDLRIG